MNWKKGLRKITLQDLQTVQAFAGNHWLKITNESSIADLMNVPETPVQTNYKRLYQEKLEKKARENGKSVEELFQDLQQTKTEKKPEPLQAKKSKTLNSQKSLNDILNVDLIKKETPENIGKIWNSFHSTKNCVSAAIDPQLYSKLSARGKQYPMFVLPLPRDDGYELFLLQFAQNQIYFTTLLEYQQNRESARPQLILTHYTELENPVLMVGEIANENLKLSDAQNLVYQLQIFYITGTDAQKALVEQFWKEPSKFDHGRLIQSLTL